MAQVAALVEALVNGVIAGAALDVFDVEPTTESPLFALDSVVVTPHLGASTREAQDKAGDTIADMVKLALAGDFVPFAVNVSAAEASTIVRPYLALAERLGQLYVGLAEGVPDLLEIEYEGQLAESDTRILTLSVLKGVFGKVSEEAKAFLDETRPLLVGPHRDLRSRRMPKASTLGAALFESVPAAGPGLCGRQCVRRSHRPEDPPKMGLGLH